MKLKQGARAAVTAAAAAVVQAVKNQSCSHHQKHQPKLHCFLCGEAISPHFLLSFFLFDHNLTHLSFSLPLSGLSLPLSCSLTHSLNIVPSSKSTTTTSNQQRKKRRQTEPLSRPLQPSSPGESGGDFKSSDDILSQSSIIEFFGGSSALSRKSDNAEDKGRKHKSPNNNNKSKISTCSLV